MVQILLLTGSTAHPQRRVEKLRSARTEALLHRHNQNGIANLRHPQHAPLPASPASEICGYIAGVDGSRSFGQLLGSLRGFVLVRCMLDPNQSRPEAVETLSRMDAAGVGEICCSRRIRALRVEYHAGEPIPEGGVYVFRGAEGDGDDATETL